MQLDFEEIMSALCTRVLTRLTLRCFGQNEFQRMYCTIYTGKKSSVRLFDQDI